MEAAIIEAGESSRCGGRRWEDLPRDILVTIFERLGVADLVAGVPFACSTWHAAALDPTCWRALDLRSWNEISGRLGCSRDPPMDLIDLLEFCMNRALDSVESVHFPEFANDIDLLAVADRCPNLHYFSLANPEVSDERICKAITKLGFLRGMAVDEGLISHLVLEYVKECCKYFSELKIYAETVDEDMAFAIYDCLPHLRKLEIIDSIISRKAILNILNELKELEYLDISGYENYGITGAVLEKASRLKFFRWDSRFDEGDFKYCSDCEMDYFYQNSCDCVIDQQNMEWLATLG